MKLLPSIGLGLALCGALGCHHHVLTPEINGHPAQTLQADARKVGDAWVVTLPLPLGQWTPKAVDEAQSMEIVTVEGKAAARWRVRPERWANSERPFHFLLVGPEDRTIQMSVQYTLFSRGAQNFLNIMAHGWVWIPMPR